MANFYVFKASNLQDGKETNPIPCKTNTGLGLAKVPVHVQVRIDQSDVVTKQIFRYKMGIFNDENNACRIDSSLCNQKMRKYSRQSQIVAKGSPGSRR